MDQTLADLIGRGAKVDCPICAKRFMSEAYRPFTASGIGQHIRAMHPALEPEVIAAGKHHKHMEASARARIARDKIERPLREHVVTGAFLDDVQSELRSLIDMMEPYWAQGNAADSALALVEKIEAMQGAPAACSEGE